MNNPSDHSFYFDPNSGHYSPERTAGGKCVSGLFESVADAIDAARYAHPEHPRERPMAFSEADKSDREYALRLARAALKAAFDAIEQECWSLKCESYANGAAGDADVGWEVISHHMAKPTERIEGQGHTPILALCDALARADR